MDKNDFISRKISILKDEHPDWSHDKLIAVAFSYYNKMQQGGIVDKTQLLNLNLSQDPSLPPTTAVPMSFEEQQRTIAPQMPIDRILYNVQTQEPKQGLPEGTYTRVDYKGGRQSDYLTPEGLENFKRMNNYRLFMEQQAQKKMQQGGTLKIEPTLPPYGHEIINPIKSVQKGVNQGNEGYYVYYGDPNDPQSDKVFFTNSEYELKKSLQKPTSMYPGQYEPLLQAYLKKNNVKMEEGGFMNLPVMQQGSQFFDINSQTLSPQQDFSVQNQDRLRSYHTPAQPQQAVAQQYPIAPNQFPAPTFQKADVNDIELPQGQAPSQQEYASTLKDGMMTDYGENLRYNTEQGTVGERTPTGKTLTKEEYFNKIKLLNPYGDVDIPVAANMLGQSIGYEGDQKGWNAVRGIASAGKIVAGLGRGILSGVASQKSWNQSYQDYLANQKDQGNVYTALQEGGKITVADSLTGAYTTEDLNGANVEVENGEIIKDGQTQEVTKAVGETHENGGIKTNLPDQSKVISDHTQIGAKNAKKYRDEFGVTVKASDTFAKVMDKVQTKIGLKKIIKDEADIIKEIDKATTKGTANDTLDVNMKFLQSKMLELQAKKQPLEDLQKVAFESVFADQERIPKKGTKEGEAQLGGMMYNDQIIGLSKQYNVAPERVQELLKMEDGGGIDLNNVRVSNRYEDKNKYTYQNPSDTDWQTFGDLLKSNPKEVLAEIKRTQPELYDKFLKDGKYKDQKNIEAYQKGINDNYTKVLKSAEVRFGKDSEAYNKIKQDIEASNFLPVKTEFRKDKGKELNTEVRGFDSKFGNFTSTRPNYEIPTLPKEDYEKVKKAGVNSSYELQNKFPELYDKYVKKAGLEGDFYIGQFNPEEAKTNTTPTEKSPETLYKERTLTTMPMFPSDMILTPSNIMPIKKHEIALERMTPVKQSIEPNIVEAQRQTQAAVNNFSYLPDNQRAAMLSEYMTNQGSAVNDALSKAEQTNVMAQQQADQFNIGQRAKEDMMNIQFAQNYEQRALMGLDNYERRLQGYYNKLSAENKQKYADTRDLNLLNAMNENFQTTGNDIVFMNNPLMMQANTKASPFTAEEQKQWAALNNKWREANKAKKS